MRAGTYGVEGGRVHLSDVEARKELEEAWREEEGEKAIGAPRCWHGDAVDHVICPAISLECWVQAWMP